MKKLTYLVLAGLLLSSVASANAAGLGKPHQGKKSASHVAGKHHKKHIAKTHHHKHA
jgi:hypothetical protein